MELVKRTLEFIRDYRNYAGLVDMAQTVHPHYRHEITGSEPEFSVHFSGISESEFEQKPLKDVSDSDEFVLIDIGSHLGTRITLPFARARPKVRIYLVDTLTRDDIVGDRAYAMFSVRTPVSSDDIEGSVNRLLEENRYHNVRYVQKKLRFSSSLDLGIEDEVKGKRIILTGFKNPRGLGNLTIEEAIRLEAERVYLNNSSLENIVPESKHFDWIRKYLSEYASKEEIDWLIGLFKDGEVKYNYKHGSKREFAVALKLLFVLAQKAKLEENGFEVRVLLNIKKKRNNHFNQPDFNLIGWKEK